MAITGEAVSVPTESLSNLIETLGSLGNWLQAIGIIAILWIILSTINWWINHKRLKKIDAIIKDMQRIEKKIDKALKR